MHEADVKRQLRVSQGDPAPHEVSGSGSGSDGVREEAVGSL